VTSRSQSEKISSLAREVNVQPLFQVGSQVGKHDLMSSRLIVCVHASRDNRRRTESSREFRTPSERSK
jgi:hypothetical protein